MKNIMFVIAATAALLLSNPYPGQSMPTCGEIKRTF